MYGGYSIGAFDILSHITNSVTMVIDFWIVAIPFRLAHIIHFGIIGLCYMLFSIIYHFSV